MQKPTLFIFFLFFFYLPLAFASTNDCLPTPITLQDHTIIFPDQLSKKPPQIYFIKNISSQSIFIDHKKIPTTGASAGWSSYLRPGNWSAIALNKSRFALDCSMIQPGKVVTLPCTHTISVCTPFILLTKKKLKGSYWLAEDKEWETLIKTVEKKGIVFKTPNSDKK